MTVDALLKELQAKKYKPVYIFHGDEPYYPEQLVKYMEEHILSADEKEFNFNVLYGADVSPEDVVVAARRFPMMAEYQLTIVKEAQAMKRPGSDVFQRLVPYLENPNPTTILVLFFRGETMPKRAAAAAAEAKPETAPLVDAQGKAAKPAKKQKSFGEAAKAHVVLESNRLRDDKIPEWASQYFSKKGYRLNGQAALLLAESVGNELDKVVNEADKLMLNFPPGTEFQVKHIEESVGVSKEYSLFELTNALSRKDVLRANRIAHFMGNNEKAMPIQMVLPGLLTYFSKLLLLHWAKSSGNKSDSASLLGLSPFIARQYEAAARLYSPAKLIKIVHHIRDTDMKSKGWNNPSAGYGALMKELVFKILH